MKRVLLSAVMFGMAGLFIGCGETDKATTTQKIETPGGTTEKKVTVEEKKTGDHKEAPRLRQASGLTPRRVSVDISPAIDGRPELAPWVFS